MKTHLTITLGALFLFGWTALSAEARGPRGGGAARGGFRGSYSAPQRGGYRGTAGGVQPPSSGVRSGAAAAPKTLGGASNSAKTIQTQTGPLGGTYTGGGQSGTVTGPQGGAATGGAHGGVYTGPGGTTVVTGAAGGTVTGPGGNSVTGGGRGTVVVTPNGNVYVAGTHGGVASVNETYYVNGAHLQATAAAVNQAYPYANTFTTTWYAQHPGAWLAAGWTAATAYTAATWAATAAYTGVSDEPVDYDYGSTVVYEDGQVYQDGEPIATQEEYYQQAQATADAGREANPASAEQWRPLGVFALLQRGETSSDNLFQLALNPEGVVRGNYFHALTETTLPVYGSVDPQTQRVAWTVGEKKDIVYEAGLANLTQPATPALVHFGSQRTEQLTLVRIEPQSAPPADGAK